MHLQHSNLTRAFLESIFCRVSVKISKSRSCIFNRKFTIFILCFLESNNWLISVRHNFLKIINLFTDWARNSIGTRPEYLKSTEEGTAKVSHGYKSRGKAYEGNIGSYERLEREKNQQAIIALWIECFSERTHSAIDVVVPKASSRSDFIGHDFAALETCWAAVIDCFCNWFEKSDILA